jgi:two-component system alkaline phosphatase synthesis response regulator PhoP
MPQSSVAPTPGAILNSQKRERHRKSDARRPACVQRKAKLQKRGSSSLSAMHGVDEYRFTSVQLVDLLTQVDALIRRAANAARASSTSATSQSHRFGDISVDFSQAKVNRAGEAVDLSLQELKLLRCFVERRGFVLTRDELLHAVWGNTTPSTRTVDVHVARLRQKLEDNPRRPRFIRTVHGRGYRFDAGDLTLNR